MKNYFRYATDLPPGGGFEMFGICHIIWIIIIVTSSFLLSRIYNGSPESYMIDNENDMRKIRITKRNFRKTVGIIMPVISIYRDIVLAVTGHFDRYYLPFHLCGMALWIGALYCFNKSRFVGVVYVSLCVPGAMGALIFPDWTDYPLWNYMHIHDFISHGLIVAWGICLIVSGEIIPKISELWMPVVFGIVGIMILIPVNKWLGTNYWFLSLPSSGSPLVDIMTLMGERWYLPGYIGFVTFIVVLWVLAVNIVNIWINYLHNCLLIIISKSVKM